MEGVMKGPIAAALAAIPAAAPMIGAPAAGLPAPQATVMLETARTFRGRLPPLGERALRPIARIERAFGDRPVPGLPVLSHGHGVNYRANQRIRHYLSCPQ
jgi:hypothetical protein